MGKEQRKEPGVSALGTLRNFKTRLRSPCLHSATFAKSWQSEHGFSSVLKGKERIPCLGEYDLIHRVRS